MDQKTGRVKYMKTLGKQKKKQKNKKKTLFKTK